MGWPRWPRHREHPSGPRTQATESGHRRTGIATSNAHATQAHSVTRASPRPTARRGGELPYRFLARASIASRTIEPSSEHM